MFSKAISKVKNVFKGNNMHQEEAPGYEYKWYDIGPDNPFNKRVLDCRKLTFTVSAFSSDKKVVDTYNALRCSDGRNYITESIENQATRSCNLEYPHNGVPLEGILFKANAMDVKWDIYCYDNVLYFTRSWLGELVYKAYVKIESDKLSISKIDYSNNEHFEEEPELVENNVHFLIMSHALGRVYPHPIPKILEKVEPETIAIYSFSLFGNKACYATTEGILDTEIGCK